MVLTDMEHFFADVECLDKYLNVENAGHWAKDNSKRILALIEERQKMVKVIEAADEWIAGGAKGLPIEYFTARGELEE